MVRLLARFDGAAARSEPAIQPSFWRCDVLSADAARIFPEDSLSTMTSPTAMFSSGLFEPEAGRRARSRQQNSERFHRALRRIGIRLLSWGMVLAAAGCGSGDAPVKVAPVSGIVKYNGVPVRDAYVKFSQKGCPIVAGGFTNDAGRFELTSYEDGDGAPVGENLVTVTVMARPSEEADTLQAQQAAAEAIQDPLQRRKKMTEVMGRQKNAQRAPPAAEARSRIPGKYASESTSKLSFTVEAGQENECELDLKD